LASIGLELPETSLIAPLLPAIPTLLAPKLDLIQAAFQAGNTIHRLSP
jgi:hypothetical protein